MAALMTSVIDNPGKVSEYILVCRSMGIRILSPDINEGQSGFSVASEKEIRYGLSAIRSVGAPVIRAIELERTANGKFVSLRDLIERLSGKEVNKRTIESFIKAGALDSLGGTRKQFMLIYSSIIDTVNEEGKNNLSGQMSLFDMAGDTGLRQSLDIKLPDVGEYPEETKLMYEKEVLGVYVTGHPLQEYESVWKKNITAMTTDFIRDEQTGAVKLAEGSRQTIGGMISDINVKHTKNGDTMAIINLEDLVGNTEVIIWPKTYSANRELMENDRKVFIEGRVKVDDERDGQLMADKVVPFELMPKKLFLQYDTMETYESGKEALEDILTDSHGIDTVVIFIKEGRMQKNIRQKADSSEIIESLIALLGADNVKVV